MILGTGQKWVKELTFAEPYTSSLVVLCVREFSFRMIKKTFVLAILEQNTEVT